MTTGKWLENERKLGRNKILKHTIEQEEEKKANKCGEQDHRRNKCIAVQK